MAWIQGDQMSFLFLKKWPKMWPNQLPVTINTQLAPWKQVHSTEMCTTFVIFKINNRPIGENSPNLFTLLGYDSGRIYKLMSFQIVMYDPARFSPRDWIFSKVAPGCGANPGSLGVRLLSSFHRVSTASRAFLTISFFCLKTFISIRYTLKQCDLSYTQRTALPFVMS
jgi:hypothetical protein